MNGSRKGNKSLTNPIGLITADEVVYAGGDFGTLNQSYYLFTARNYWTLSPYVFNYTGTMLCVASNGSFSAPSMSSTAYGVRPVINLKANTKFTYDSESTKGTMDDPYVVE